MFAVAASPTAAGMRRIDGYCPTQERDHECRMHSPCVLNVGRLGCSPNRGGTHDQVDCIPPMDAHSPKCSGGTGISPDCERGHAGCQPGPSWECLGIHGLRRCHGSRDGEIGDAITFTFSGDCLTPGGGADSDMANIVGPHDAADGIGYLGQPISSTGSWSTWGSYGSFGPNDWYGTPGPGPASSVTAVLLGIPPAGVNSPINAGVPLTPGDQIASFEVNNGPPAGTTIAIVWDGAPASAPDAQMPAWLQSYGRSGSQSCRPGWSPSWAQWAVAATGGSVCNRTVFWNGSAWMQSPSQGWGASDPSQTTAWDGR